MKQDSLEKLKRLRDLRSRSAEKAAWLARNEAETASLDLQRTRNHLVATDLSLRMIMQQAAVMPSLDARDRANISDAIAEGKARSALAADAVLHATNEFSFKERDALTAHNKYLAARNAQEQWGRLLEHLERSRNWAEENAAEQVQELDYVLKK